MPNGQVGLIVSLAQRETAMKAILCLTVMAALLARVDAQPNDPPKYFTNGIGIKFVSIPAGTFVMGSPKDETGRKPDEVPHKVTLTKGFFLSVTLVTKRQWNAVMNEDGKLPRADRDLPMETVSWGDCQEFLKKLRAKDGKPYRLPTEAEWEYACRAGTTTAYHGGNTLSTRQANFGKGMKGASKLATTPVGRYPANPWGLHDMHGNLWEWCQDWYNDYPPKDTTDPHGSKDGTERVLRGGSFTDIAQHCRSATRHKCEPNVRDHTIGFRVCMTAE
jgi:formylglycine-generating enzyme required for sulfatase activity